VEDQRDPGTTDVCAGNSLLGAEPASSCCQGHPGKPAPAFAAGLSLEMESHRPSLPGCILPEMLL
jgi:hypothetical protein